MTVFYADIVAAEKRTRSNILVTSCRKSTKLSKLLGCDLYIKYENENITGAFKERGALNKLLCLTDTEKTQGVIAASAGNHAQGVAYHAGKLGIPAVIVMPVSTPMNKVTTTRNFGAEVILAGETFDACLETMREIQQERALTLIHPFDDPQVIAGQGTIGLEILEQIKDLDNIIIPIGGGGMMAGVALALKEKKPNLKIYGVQSEAYPAFYNAYHHTDHPFSATAGLAEGIAVREPGKLTFEIIQHLVEDIFIVPEETIEEAVSLLLTECKTVAEGAGAAGLAAIIQNPDLFKGQKTAFILCGGNIDTRLLSAIMTRTLFRQERLFTIRMTTNDRPGFLANVSKIIGDADGNITAVRHNRYDLTMPAKDTMLTITVEARDHAHSQKIKTELTREGFNILP